MRLPAAALWLALACIQPAAALELEGRPVQGGLLQGRADPGAAVLLDGRALRVAADGRFVLGFGRDHGPAALLELRHPDGRAERVSLAVERRSYDIERIDGLPQRQVTPAPEDLERIRREAALIGEIRRRDTPEAWFRSGWRWPVVGRISGVYGSQRILNGEPRQPHFGIDIAAPLGTPVAASTDGIVALAEADLYFTGGTVILDHGHGLVSIYSHLSEVSAAVGQVVRQGQEIGRVGATGRATGPHLDWRVSWFDERLDPALLAGPMPVE